MAVGDIKAGRAYVEIATDDAKLNKGLAAAQAHVLGFARGINSAITGVGAFVAGIGAAIASVTVLTQGLTGAVQRASEFVDIADRLGADVEGLQGLAFAAGRLGVDLEEVNTAIQKFQKGLGGGTISKELKAIGIEVDDIIGLKADEAFLRVVDALRSVSDQNEQAALTAKLFGRSGQDLQGIIKTGSASLRQMASEGKSLGVIMGEDLARGFEQAGDAAEDASKAMQGLFNQPFFQERIAAYSDLVSEIVTLGKAETEFFNSTELKIARQNAKVAQMAVDQENAAKFAEAQVQIEKDRNAEADAFNEELEYQLSLYDDLSASMGVIVDREQKRAELMKEGQKIFEQTRTPEERFRIEVERVKEIAKAGGIDHDTAIRRIFQLGEGLPKQLERSSVASGTFNARAVGALSANSALLKASQDTAKNTKQIADMLGQGAVLF